MTSQGRRVPRRRYMLTGLRLGTLGARLPRVRHVPERAAAEEVAAERFVMIVIEQIGDVGADCHVAGERVAAVEIEDAVARHRTPYIPASQGNPSTQRYRIAPVIRARSYAAPALN